MHKAILNSELIATKAGDVTVYNYDGETREYISTSNEYLAVGVGIPACSCLDAPGTHKAGYAICRSADFNSWEYVPDHRGETVYSTKTGESKEIKAPGDYPENTTTNRAGVGTGLACIASSPRFCGFRNNLTGQSWYGGSRELGRLLGFVVAYVLQ